MIKYERVNRNTNKIYLESILVSGEKVIWRGKTKKKAERKREKIKLLTSVKQIFINRFPK